MAASKKTKLKTALWNALRLHQTCPVSALQAVKAALLNGSDPNDGYGTWVPLGWAIRHQATDIALCLIQAGASVDAVENGKHLVSECLLIPGMESFAMVLANHGAKPSGAILRTAAKRAHIPVMRWALEAGVDPNDLTKHAQPALNSWPAKVPVPQLLLDATFSRDLTDQAAARLIDLICRRKNKVLLEYLVKHACVSEKTKWLVLKSCVSAIWRDGVDMLLGMRYCDPGYPQPAIASPVVSCAHWISRKSPRKGLEVLKLLMAYGYDVNAAHGPLLPNHPDGLPTPDAFLLLRATKHSSRAALLGFLVENNLQPVVAGVNQVKTLAHELISCNEWELLRTLPQIYPDVSWELPGAPGLLAAWAHHHEDEKSQNQSQRVPANNDSAPIIPPEESLAIVQSLRGFDLQKRNTKGQTGLRVFMQRPGGSHFSKMTTLLIHSGLNPFLPDTEGISDLMFLDSVKLPPGLRANFQSAALLYHSAQASTDHSKARRL